MSAKYTFLKKDPKKLNHRFNSARISHKLTSKINSFSGSSSAYFNSYTRNKKRTLITSVLSTSKHLIIAGNRPESSKSIISNIHYEYPYKPNIFLRLKSGQRGTKFLFSDELNLLTRDIKPNNLSSLENSSISTFKSSSQNTVKNNLLFNLSANKKNKFNVISSKHKVLKIRDKPFSDNKIIPKSNNESEVINENKNLNILEEKFLYYIDCINTDKKNLSQYKNELKDYFDKSKLNKQDIYFFKNLMNNYEYKETEEDNYFTSDFHSIKKNNFTIKDLNITLKLSSLKLIFYEIKDNKEDNKSNYYKNYTYINSFNSQKHIINTKLKFPFEYLSIFYGLNFDEFINILIALIDFDFSKNKFNIDYNNFLTKIEDCKVLYDFFTEKSFTSVYNDNQSREYFLYNWDIKGKDNEIKHYLMKILLPQMKLRINCADRNKIKFYSSISIKTMKNLIKNSFNNWDFFIFIYFAEHKLFRFEINKIITGKYSNSNHYINFKSGQNLSFDLSSSITKINTMKKNHKTYGFFYTFINGGKTEKYFIYFILPQISIFLHSFTKNFELDYKILFQLNKLRKYFLPEDLIKYNMSIENFRYKSNYKGFDKKEQKRVISSKTMKINKRNSGLRFSLDKKSNLKKFLKSKGRAKFDIGGTNPLMPRTQDINEDIKDINLNLDYKMLNFDISILKFINAKDNHKTDFKDNAKKESVFNAFQINNTSKKLNIKIGNLELSWTNQEGLSNNYKFDKKISQYLLDFHQYKWRIYVENNIDKIITGGQNIKRTNSNNKISFFQKRKY